jgi:hypothetical protein
MDKLSFKLHQLDDYDNCFKTLKETSYDERHDIYLCCSPKSVYDFDCLTRILYPAPYPCSFDALLIDNSNLYCVEFKNQSPKDIKKNKDELQNKLIDGQHSLKKLFANLSIKTSLYRFVFCVVYKESKSKIYGGYKSKIARTTNKFNLESKLKHIFKTNQVITNDIEFFAKEFNKRLNN